MNTIPLPDTAAIKQARRNNPKMRERDLATQLGISVKTVENQISKALKLLREALAGSWGEGGGNVSMRKCVNEEWSTILAFSHSWILAFLHSHM